MDLCTALSARQRGFVASLTILTGEPYLKYFLRLSCLSKCHPQMVCTGLPWLHATYHQQAGQHGNF